jgi:hypothetical protein
MGTQIFVTSGLGARPRPRPRPICALLLMLGGTKLAGRQEVFYMDLKIVFLVLKNFF